MTIPTASTPRVVVRTLGEAVAETGLRFSTLSLTPAQVDLLQRHAEQLIRYLYLQGPPGTGKTVILFLGALSSLRQGWKVNSFDFCLKVELLLSLSESDRKIETGG